MNLSTPKYLFDCLDDVRSKLAGRDRIAVFLDLDGTLAPITPTPKMTRLKPQTRNALQQLVHDRRYLVSVVSGRGMQDLKAIVKLPGIIYAGNHGLEIAGSTLEFLHDEAKDRIDLIRKICAELTSRFRSVRGAVVEFKTLTASIHYRLASDIEVDRIRTAVNDAVAPFCDQIRVTQGKCVLELRPAVQWNKGFAVNWIISQTGHDPAAAIYVGDDRTDEDAFAALPRSVTIKVGTKCGVTGARYFVRSPEGVLGFIQCLPFINAASSPAAAEPSPLALQLSAGE